MESDVRFVARIAYLGAGFAGWQKQREQRTVQGELESALERLFTRPIATMGAGRTDAGVHADGQIVHFDVPPVIPATRLRSALNSQLADDLRVLTVRRAPGRFHALASATGKSYRYRLAWGEPLPPWSALRTWLVPFRLDLDLLAESVALTLGEHDFERFALTGHSGHGARGTVRTVSCAQLCRRGRRADVVLEADGFLRGMVRRIVGATVEVARGAQDLAWFAELVANHAVRPAAPSAPAHGLTLERVLYGRGSGLRARS
jgi:tRNA pseudouridine38-40 synthase